MRRVLVLAAFALLAGVGTAQVDPFSFMPDGGRGLMARAFPTPEAQAEALAALTVYGRPDVAEPSLEDVFVSLARTRATGAEEAA